MKQCPTCNRIYPDDTLSFCLDDGTPLITSYDPEATRVINPSHGQSSSSPTAPRRANPALYIVIALLALLVGGSLVALLKSGTRDAQVSTPPNSERSVAANPASTSTQRQPAATAETEAKSSPTKTPDKVFALPATRSGWVPIGNGDFTIEASGEIDFGGVKSTPQGSSIVGQDPLDEITQGQVLASSLPYGALIGKIGHGKPFLVGYRHTFHAQQQVYIAINDSNYSDNTGSYTIRIQW